MPIPKPNPQESQKDYLQRCMANPTMVAEYARDQRYAICRETYKKK